MLKKGKVWGKKLVAGIMMAVIVLGNTAVSTEAATKDTGKTVAVIQEDNYRKTLCKGFLGKSYGSVVDGIRCDCSGYTRAALNRLESKGKSGTALKNVQVGAVCTRDWVNGSNITYTRGVAEDDGISWSKQTKLSIGKKSSGASKVSDLELGDVVVYGCGSSTTHIAVYFGKFSSIDEVKDYLENLGLYNMDSLKKVSGNKYQYKGKTVIRQYGNSSYWRIHATSSGIMIDNDIAGTSPYTSSFGSWKWTFSSGIDIIE